MKQIFKIFIQGAVTSLLLVTASADDQGGSDFSALTVYNAEKIGAKETGTYEYGGWVFFHSREALESTRLEDKLDAEASARDLARESLFGWIDRHANKSATCPPVVARLSQLNSTFLSNDDEVFERTINVPVQVIDCRAESGRWFVFTMAVAKTDLLAEASKGPFIDRPETVYGQWGIISRNRLGQTNQVEFLRQSGAMDLLTLSAEQRKGVNILFVENSNTNEVCKSCIDDLRNSVAALQGDAASEYKKLLEGLYCKIQASANQFPEIAKHGRVWIMISSFASCLQQTESPDIGGIKAFRAFRARRKDAAVVRKDLIDSLNKTPGSALLWSALGESYLEQDAMPLALSCFRNALRIERNYPYALDRMAAAYERYNYPALARGLAIFAYVLAEEEEYRKNSVRILGIKNDSDSP